LGIQREKESINSFGANPEYIHVYLVCPPDCPEYAEFTHTRFQAFPRVQPRPSFFCSVLHHTPGCTTGRMYSYTSTSYTIFWCGTLLSIETTYFTLQNPKAIQYPAPAYHLLKSGSRDARVVMVTYTRERRTI
jgi:hypothetical protein